MEKELVFLHFKSFVLVASLVLSSALGIFAQAIAPQTTPTPAKAEKKDDKSTKPGVPAIAWRTEAASARNCSKSEPKIFTANCALTPDSM